MIECAMSSGMFSARVAVVSGFSTCGRTSISETSVEDDFLVVEDRGLETFRLVDFAEIRIRAGLGGIAHRCEGGSRCAARISSGLMSPTTTKVMRSGV